MAVVRNHDAIWNSEQLDRTALSALTTRLRALTAEDLGRWRATLSTIEGQDIGDVWTAVIIASCDRLFDGTAVARPDAATVAERVEGLSHGMVSELSAALGISNAEAALQLATVDWFYDVDSVASRSQRVALAIAEVKSLRQAVLRH
jgi:hypothetical protein